MAIDIADISNAVGTARYAEAERMAEAFLVERNGDEAALTLLGIARQLQGRPRDAAGTYAELTRLFPQTREHWSNLGTALREAGDLNGAETAYGHALALAPDDGTLLGNLGLLHMERYEFVQARALLLDAVRALPNDAEFRIYAAMMCYECGDNPTAEALVENWRRWDTSGDELRIDLAWVLVQLGHVTDGESLLNQSRTLGVDNPRVLSRLVLLLERVNRLDEARALLDRLPAPESIDDPGLQRDIVAAMSAMAMRARDLDASRDLLKRLLATVGQERHRGTLYFGLARVEDHSSDSNAAMMALERAHIAQLVTAQQLAPELMAPGVEPLQSSTQWLSAEQCAAWIDRDHGPPMHESPVFVVGFPRSGTTMLEQMLDAHPSMRSMDERAFIQALADLMQRQGLRYPDDLPGLDTARRDALRRAYRDMVTRVVALAPDQRIVDKNPLNLLRLPMMQRLFPHARTILALRHPCDVILSCYMQNFRSPAFQILCSTLERLARGYVNAMRHWIHHAELLQPHILTLRYEDLLDDFDGHVRRIGDFLELDDARTLTGFHEHARDKGFISTPSYAAVVEPPNKKAVGRWRRYEKYFEPVLPILDPILRHWRYAA